MRLTPSCIDSVVLTIDTESEYSYMRYRRTRNYLLFPRTSVFDLEMQILVRCIFHAGSILRSSTHRYLALSLSPFLKTQARSSTHPNTLSFAAFIFASVFFILTRRDGSAQVQGFPRAPSRFLSHHLDFFDSALDLADADAYHIWLNFLAPLVKDTNLGIKASVTLLKETYCKDKKNGILSGIGTDITSRKKRKSQRTRPRYKLLSQYTAR
ncbi:MAG: hypothetical protein JOS17DRAFT_752915 [Linnemannia elongata]|nr:MAG: hypothetical protein JOS17DRAFT_752915 [Linnemannia elongata]